MDEPSDGIIPEDLCTCLGTAAVPIVLDVRRSDDPRAAGGLVVSAIPCAMNKGRWGETCPQASQIVAYCADGREVTRAPSRAIG